MAAGRVSAPSSPSPRACPGASETPPTATPWSRRRLRPGDHYPLPRGDLEEPLLHLCHRPSVAEPLRRRRPSHIRWIRVDIGSATALERVGAHIARDGGADYLVHLAAHYDFDNVESPEYQRTTVDGTRHVLELGARLAVRHLIFASSVAACPVPEPGEVIDEESVPDAEFPYARSKRAGEELVRDFSRRVPASVVRLAAVFTDGCEYPPLYVFLETWLSKRWNARILTGHGLVAVPYIHVRDVSRLFLRLLDQSDGLPYRAAASPGSGRPLQRPGDRRRPGRLRSHPGVCRALGGGAGSSSPRRAGARSDRPQAAGILPAVDRRRGGGGLLVRAVPCGGRG